MLAGGRSTRMGRDKDLIEYHGRPQREHLFDLLAGFCKKVFTSCRNEQHIPAQLHPICDRYDFGSPLNGILTAFRAHPGHTWLAVAVDMPNVNAATIAFLLKHRDKQKLATCFIATDGKPEPLLTIWEPECLPSLTDFAHAGKISPREYLLEHDVLLLQPPDPRVLVNVNSPEEMGGIISPK